MTDRSKLAATLSIAMFSTALGACSGSDDHPKPDSSLRELTGSVDIKSYALDNGVVVAQSRAGRTVMAPIGLRGQFKLELPVGETYRLLVANTTRSGRYEVLSRVLWAKAGLTSGIKTQSSGSGSDGSGGGGGGDSSGVGAPDSSAVCSESSSSSADLPYDAKIPLGATYRLSDSFREKGALPAAILDVKSDGGDWRLAELIANASFVVTQADCDHQGNKDTGRDRVFVTWKNHDGSTETDHLDMRYCVGDVAPSAMAEGAATASGATSSQAPCDQDDAHVCQAGSAVDSQASNVCEGLEPSEGQDTALSSCPSGGFGSGGTTGSTASNTGLPAGTEPGSAPSSSTESGSGSGSISGATAVWITVRPGSIGNVGVIRPIIGGASAVGSITGAAGAPASGGATATATSADGVGGGASAAGAGCIVSADCQTGLRCVASKCVTPIK